MSVKEPANAVGGDCSSLFLIAGAAASIVVPPTFRNRRREIRAHMIHQPRLPLDCTGRGRARSEVVARRELDRAGSQRGIRPAEEWGGLHADEVHEVRA